MCKEQNTLFAVVFGRKSKTLNTQDVAGALQHPRSAKVSVRLYFEDDILAQKFVNLFPLGPPAGTKRLKIPPSG